MCLCRQDLYQRCEKMRPTLFRLASDTEDNDEALGESSSFFIQVFVVWTFSPWIRRSSLLRYFCCGNKNVNTGRRS